MGPRWTRYLGALGAVVVIGVIAAVVMPGASGAAQSAPTIRLVSQRSSAVVRVGNRDCRPSGSEQGPPLMAVVGASFTAGVGAERPEDGWAHLVAQQLGWRAEVDGVSGSGFLAPGADGLGPMDRQLDRLDLPGTRPSLVIIQSGHNDVGQADAQLVSSVEAAVHQVHDIDPAARVALMTVFTTGQTPDPASAATDAVIVRSARAADPRVIILDPLAEAWHFPTIGDGLHPNEEGHRWIAQRAAMELWSAGVQPYRATCPRGVA